MSRGNLLTLRPFAKGERHHVGRAKGVPNRTTRALKIALIDAAEKSRHSKDRGKSLEAYCTYLADEHPVAFAGLLGKLIPVQAKVKTDGNVRFEKLNMSMSLAEMISNFEMKIKSDYRPPPPVLIEPDDDDEPDA